MIKRNITKNILVSFVVSVVVSILGVQLLKHMDETPLDKCYKSGGIPLVKSSDNKVTEQCLSNDMENN